MSITIQIADWVTCGDNTSMIGTVKRIARDGAWADVFWGSHSKRMPVTSLTVQHTIPMSPDMPGWEVTDLTRQQEMERAAMDAFQAVPSYVERYAAN